MQPLQSARSFRTFLHDSQSLNNRRSRLGLFTLEDRQAAGSLMDMLLAGAMASDRAQPIPAPADDPRFGVVTATPFPVSAEVSNAVALVDQTQNDAANSQSVSLNPLGTFAGEGGGQFIGFGDLDQPSNAAPVSIGDWRGASALPTSSGHGDESASPSFVRPTAQNAPTLTATTMESNTSAAQAAAYLAAIGTNATPPKFENPTVSFGPMYGYSGGGKVILITKAVVTEVEYLGDVIRIAADPGTPAYPMTGPQYLDNNADGIIEPEQGDLQLPVAYPRGSYVVVTAKFKVETTLMEGSPGTGEVKIEGTSDSSGIHILPTIASWSGDYVTLPPTSSMNTLANVVQYYPSSGYPYSQSGFGINWTISHNQAGQSGFIPAGASFNEMYVTLAAPNITPVYHTLIHLSVPISAAVNAADEPTIIAQTWKIFQTKNVTNKQVDPMFNGRQLKYYDQWDAKAITMKDLLVSLDGQCGAFTDLFISSCKAAGARTTVYKEVEFTPVKVDDAWMLINKWDWQGNGTNNNNTYKYWNTVADPTMAPFNLDFTGTNKFYKKNAAGKWDYYWGLTAEVTDDKTGISGQNTANPLSNFVSHVTVDIGGKIFDPSYGTGPFVSTLQWEDESVSGFMAPDFTPQFTHRLIMRKNPQLAVPDLKVITQVVQ